MGAKQWLDRIRDLLSPQVIVVLVGAKSDLNIRNVSLSEAQAFANENGSI